MVLVRKSELACRNGWAQDLWEPGPAALADDSGGEPHERALPIGPNGHAPTTGERVAELGRPSTSTYTDKIITTIAAKPGPALTPVKSMRITPDRPPEFLAEDGREFERESHSEVREARRRVVEQRDAQKRRNSDDKPTDQPAATIRPIARQQPDPLIPSAPTMTGSAIQGFPMPPAELDLSNDGVPTVKRVPRSDRTRRDVPLPSPPSGERSPRPGPPPVAGPPVAMVSPRRAIAPSKPVAPRAQQTEQLPIEEVRAYAASMPDARRATPSPGAVDVPERKPAPASGQARANRERAALAGSADRQPARHTAGRSAPAHAPSATIARRQVAVTVEPAPPAAPAPVPVDPIDCDQRLRGVLRCCATCRDFRPLDDGEQGWCANPYAFAERRMVKSDQLACHSSLGTWWLPHDDLWLERADVTHHGRPTPLIDNLLSRPNGSFQGKGSRGA